MRLQSETAAGYVRQRRLARVRSRGGLYLAAPLTPHGPRLMTLVPVVRPLLPPCLRPRAEQGDKQEVPHFIPATFLWPEHLHVGHLTETQAGNVLFILNNREPG